MTDGDDITDSDDKLQKSRKTRIRIIWASVYAAILSIMIYACVIVLTEWWNQDPAIHFKYVPLPSLQLPHIYLCPTFWMDKRKVNETDGLTLDLLEHMRAGFLGFNNYKRKYKEGEMELLEEQYRKFLDLHPDFDYRVFFRDKISLDYLGAACYFEEEKFHCDDKFEQQLTESGLCAYFDSSSNLNQTVEGPLGGLRFQITKDSSEEPMVVRHSGFDRGVHMNVGGHWQPKLPDPIYIPAQVRAYVSVNASLRDCNCTMFIYGIQNISQSQFCTPAEYMNCAWLIFKKPAEKECVKNTCLRECNQFIMRPSVSYTTYDDQRIDWYNQKYNKSWKPTTNIMIHVYQSRIAVDQFWEEYAYTWADMISNIGGQMGLWLGLSLAAVLDIVVKLINRTVEGLEKKPTKRNSRERAGPYEVGENEPKDDTLENINSAHSIVRDMTPL